MERWMNWRVSPEVGLAVALTGILAAMVVPLPVWCVDFGLALNLAAALALLVSSVFAKEVLRVTAFPTLLLLTTLFRLGLTVSSTRLALAEGYAGQVIEAFGEFVVRGDYVVGGVVFAIMALVQFLVVAKGAERVAEVSARFTLDALPGKQMAIDADLRAGAIDLNQARSRRRALERESQMFGAMDGAMKFVKGDVIAGLVIVAVNLVGGTVLGVLHGQMAFGEALENYALIAIGDGLVSQIPSLCIAVAAGVVVTRVASEDESRSLGSEIVQQFFGQPLALGVVGAMCLALGLLPGMPLLPFGALAGAAFWGSAWSQRRSATSLLPPASPSSESAPPEAPTQTGMMVPLAIELSASLSSLASEEDGKLPKKLLAQVQACLNLELGIKIPSIQLRTGSLQLRPDRYAILLEEIPVATGILRPNRRGAPLARAQLAALSVGEGEEAKHPVTGKEICWVSPEAQQALSAAGISLWEPGELLCEHLQAILRRRAELFVGVQEVQQLLEMVEAQAPALVKEVVAKIPLALLTEVLRRLLSEGVSVRNMRAILEGLVSPRAEGDAAALTEHARAALQRYLSHKYAPSGPLHAYLLDPGVEELLRQRPEQMDPLHIGEILNGVRRAAWGGTTVILTAPDVRRGFRKLCEGPFPDVAVLSYAELEPSVQVRPLGKIDLPRRVRA